MRQNTILLMLFVLIGVKNELAKDYYRFCFIRLLY